jgi:hypothetical protein
LLIAVMAHRVLADWVLAGAFILFSLTVLAGIVWAEIDRRRSVGGQTGMSRIIRPLESRRERW